MSPQIKSFTDPSLVPAARRNSQQVEKKEKKKDAVNTRRPITMHALVAPGQSKLSTVQPGDASPTLIGKIGPPQSPSPFRPVTGQ
jgi:hypothetical protein